MHNFMPDAFFCIENENRVVAVVHMDVSKRHGVKHVLDEHLVVGVKQRKRIALVGGYSLCSTGNGDGIKRGLIRWIAYLIEVSWLQHNNAS
jgi:hypothetical protein